MTFGTSPQGRPLRDNHASIPSSSLSESRSFGEIVPEMKSRRSKLAGEESPFAKSWAHFVAGGAGGMLSATLTCPLDVLKTRLQSTFYQAFLASSRASRGLPPIETMSFSRASLLHVRETFQILFEVPRLEGWRALFKGLGPNLIGVVPARSINFFTYGNTKKYLSASFNNGEESMLVQLCAAAIAGVATGTATNPIWLVKTRLQLDKAHAKHHGQRQYRNALDCTVQTVRHEGIRGLYRGLTASYLGVAESTMQWLLYEKMKKYLREREERLALSTKLPTAWDQVVSWTGKPIAAGSAKFIAALLTYPHEVVRTRLRQAPLQNGQLKYTGLMQCFSLIFREEGVAALYGGLVPHMLRVVPSAAIMFGTYEAVLHLLGTTSEV